MEWEGQPSGSAGPYRAPDLEVRHGWRRVGQRRSNGQVPGLSLDLGLHIDVVVEVVNVGLRQSLVVLWILSVGLVRF